MNRAGVDLVKSFEGLKLDAYRCSANKETIGYGNTFYEDGSRVTMKDPPITRQRAEELLLWMVRTKYLPTVMRLCPQIDTPERVAALIDFTFNLGGGNLKASTLRRRVNAQDWEAVPTELRKWNKAGGRVLKGLTIRREAEIALL